MRPDSTQHVYPIRNYVITRATMDRSDRKNRRDQRVSKFSNQRLVKLYQASRGQYGIRTHMRHGRMSTFTFHGKNNII